MKTIIDRFEQKYFLNNDQYFNLMHNIVDKIKKDQFYNETIYNIYFDNDNYDLINKSLEKPEYKEKIRLRSYNLVNNNSVVFLEIKKKFNNHTNKRRIIISYQEYLNFVKTGNLENENRQILREILYCFKKYDLKPKIKVKYDRLSYYLKDDINFRITFDNNIQYNCDINFNNYLKSKCLFNEGYIMEIKTFNSIPLWLNKILDELKIYPISFSKIGKIYEGGLI